MVSEGEVRACWALEVKACWVRWGWLADGLGEPPDWTWAEGEKEEVLPLGA